MAAVLSLADEIREAEARLKAYHNSLRVTRTDMLDTRFIEESIASHQERIEWHQKMIADIRERQANGPQIIVDTQKAIKQLVAKIALLKHKADVERLIELQKTINELQRVANGD